MLTVEIDVDAGVEQLARRPASAWRAPSRARWCARARRPARPRAPAQAPRRRPARSGSCRGASTTRRGTTSRPSSIARRCAAGRGSPRRRRRRRCRARRGGGPRRASRRSCPRRGPPPGRPSAVRVPRVRSSSSCASASRCRARLSSSTFTRGSPRKPRCGPGCARRPGRAPRLGSGRAPARPARPGARVLGPDVRVEAAGRRRDGVRRDVGRVDALRLGHRGPALLDGGDQVRVVRAEVRPAAGRARRTRRPRPTAGSGTSPSP